MPKNRLAVLPDMTHYEAFASARVAETALPFLDGQMGSTKRTAEQMKAQRPKRESDREVLERRAKPGIVVGSTDAHLRRSRVALIRKQGVLSMP